MGHLVIRRWLQFLAITAVAASAVWSAPLPTEAVGWDSPNGGNCAADNVLKIAFTGPYWVSGTKDRRYGTGGTNINARGFAEEWETIKEEDGGSAVDVQEAWGEIVATIVDLPGLSGQANCNQGFIKMDVVLAAESKWKQFRGVWQHEVGHTLGLTHAHKAPAWDGVIPTMATCLSDAEVGTSRISQDDSSAMGHKNHWTKSINPNQGFERGSYGWASVVGSDSATGIRRQGSSARILSSGTIYQTFVTTSEGGGHLVQGQVYARDAWSGIVGKLRVELIERQLTYAPDNVTCNWSSPFNESLHQGGPTGWLVIASGSNYPNSSSWKNIVTTSPFQQSTGGLVNLQIMRLHNQANGSIRVDDARIRWY